MCFRCPCLDCELTLRGSDVPEHRIAGPKTSKEDLYEMARKIASQKAGRRYYRDDVISEAYLAVAEGEATERGIENAVRRARRSEWKHARGRVHEDRGGEWNDEDGHIPFRLENISGWGPPGAPERAKQELYAALSALTEKQWKAVFLIYWEGLTQRETADAMGVGQTVVRDHLRAAIRAMKKFLTAPPKTSSKNAVGI